MSEKSVFNSLIKSVSYQISCGFCRAFYSEPLDLCYFFYLPQILSKYFDEGEKMASGIKRADLDLQFKDLEIQSLGDRALYHHWTLIWPSVKWGG